MADILNNGVLPDPANFRLSDIIIDGKPLDVKQFYSVGKNKSLLTVDFGYNAESNLPFLQGEMSVLVQDQNDVVVSLWNGMLESALLGCMKTSNSMAKPYSQNRLVQAENCIF